MSRRHNPYLFYTEYYLISGAYQVINVVNGILTYSASYSDNIKEYLRNQVASKQVVLNELVRSQHDAGVNANPENDVDEDGFVVVKMRKTKPKNANPIRTHSDRGDSVVSSLPVMPITMHNETSLTQASRHKQCKSYINTKQEFRLLVVEEVIEHVMRDIISDVIVKIDTIHKEVILRN
jgi:hypothetical protein